MIPVTRSSSPFDDTYLEHLVSDVLEVPTADASYRKALKDLGIKSTDDLMYLLRLDLTACVWTNADGDEISLSTAEVNRLMALQQWFDAQDKHTEDVWLNLTPQAFKDFRLSARTFTATTSSTSAPTSSATVSAAGEFAKSIKKSLSDYTIFKIKKHWNSWQWH